ncbi:MAG: alpha/beta fold hydrolase [Candidatus Woesearchaeota archaeon]
MPFITSSDDTKIYYTYTRARSVQKKEKQAKKTQANKSQTNKTIIFIHGWTMNHTGWKSEIAFFQNKGYDCIAVDLRGHGKSDKPKKRSAYTMNYFVKDINTIVEKNNLVKPILIGHSLGGMIILHYLKKYQEKIAKIVLIDTTYTNPLTQIPFLKYIAITPLVKNIAYYIIDHNEIHKKHYESIDFSSLKYKSDFKLWLKGIQGMPIESITACFLSILENDEKTILSSINIPTLIIVGEKDNVTPKIASRNMHSLIQKSQLEIIPKGKHDTIIQNPHFINKKINQFLKK